MPFWREHGTQGRLGVGGVKIARTAGTKTKSRSGTRYEEARIEELESARGVNLQMKKASDVSCPFNHVLFRMCGVVYFVMAWRARGEIKR